VTHLVYLAAALDYDSDYEMPADREGNQGKQAKQIALNSVAIVR
jgi:hypothetical protein